MLQNPAFTRACPRPRSPDSVGGTRDKRGESTKPRVLSPTVPGDSSHLQPICPTTGPQDGKTLLPSLSTIAETEISPQAGSSSVPTLPKRGLGFGLGQQKIGAKGDGWLCLCTEGPALPMRHRHGWALAGERLYPPVSVSGGRRIPRSYGSCFVPPWVSGLFC